MQRQLPQLVALAFWMVAAVGCASRIGSIGAVLSQTKSEGKVTVRETPAGYPAAAAGMTPGDEVLLIDGRDVRGMSPEAVHQALEGPVGTTVQLTLLRAGRIDRVAVKRAPLATTAAR